MVQFSHLGFSLLLHPTKAKSPPTPNTLNQTQGNQTSVWTTGKRKYIWPTTAPCFCLDGPHLENQAFISGFSSAFWPGSQQNSLLLSWPLLLPSILPPRPHRSTYYLLFYNSFPFQNICWTFSCWRSNSWISFRMIIPFSSFVSRSLTPLQPPQPSLLCPLLPSSPGFCPIWQATSRAPPLTAGAGCHWALGTLTSSAFEFEAWQLSHLSLIGEAG